MITFCPLVNPLCPDDLCVAPLGHVGTAEGIHLLGTWGDAGEVADIMFLLIGANQPEDLITAGHMRAQELWPEYYDGERDAYG